MMHIKLYFASNKRFDIKDVLFDSEKFHEEVYKDACFYTYPLSGAFTKFLVEKYGQSLYLNFYRNASKENLIFLYGDYDALLNEFEYYIVKEK